MNKRALIPILLIAALALVFRCRLALDVKNCLDGDESTVGVMAFHVQDRGEHPVFLFGQSHGGGHSVEAHVAAFLNGFFGRSPFHVLLPAIIGFALLVLFSSLLAARVGGLWLGLFVGLHLTFAPHFMRPSLRASGYMETMALSVFCCWLLFTRMMGPDEDGPDARPPSMGWGALLGLLTGLAYWWFEFSAILTFIMILAYAVRWKRKAVAGLIGWVIVYPIGALPLVSANLRGGFRNVAHLFSGNPVRSAFAPTSDTAFFTHQLPALFQNDNWGFFTKTIPPTAWILFSVIVIGLVVCLVRVIVVSENNNKQNRFLLLSFLYIIVFAAAYLVSPFRGETARHLLPLEPFLSIAVGVAITTLFKSRRAIGYGAGAVLLAAVIAADFSGTAIAMRDNRIGDGIDEGVACSEIGGLVTALDAKGIQDVFTNALLKWMILYRSEERIKAADVNLTPLAVRWSEYEEDVTQSPDPAFLFNRRDPHLPWLIAFLKWKHMPFHYSGTGRYVLIEPDSKVSQFEFIGWSKKVYELQRRNAAPHVSPAGK